MRQHREKVEGRVRTEWVVRLRSDATGGGFFGFEEGSRRDMSSESDLV